MARQWQRQQCKPSRCSAAVLRQLPVHTHHACCWSSLQPKQVSWALSTSLAATHLPCGTQQQTTADTCHHQHLCTWEGSWRITKAPWERGEGVYPRGRELEDYIKPLGVE